MSLESDDRERLQEAREKGEMGDPVLLNDEQVALREIAYIEGQLRAGHPDVEGLTLALGDWSEELRLIREEKEGGRKPSLSEGPQAPQNVAPEGGLKS